MPIASPYAAAIEASRDTLARRAAAYRDLVMTVVAMAALALVSALALARWWPLCLLLALPAAVLLFVRRDTTSVAGWRRSILDAWADGGLRLDMLVSTLRQVPGLPPVTLEGMLAALPLLCDDEVPLPERAQQIAQQVRQDDAAACRLLVRAALWSVGVVVVTSATIVFA